MGVRRSLPKHVENPPHPLAATQRETHQKQTVNTMQEERILNVFGQRATYEPVTRNQSQEAWDDEEAWEEEPAQETWDNKEIPEEEPYWGEELAQEAWDEEEAQASWL